MSDHRSLEDLIRWTEALPEPQLDYLLAEAQNRTESDRQDSATLDSRVFATVGWAIVGVGTLLIAGDLTFAWSSNGVPAILAIVGASVTLVSGILAMWPRTWGTGLDLDWYSQWNQPELLLMRARSLAALIHGARLNDGTLKLRSTFFRVAALGLVLEFAALVAALILNTT